MPTPTLTSHIFPSTAVSTGSGVAWTTPANAVSENATSTTSALTKSATTSQTLRVTGFDFSAIPAGSLITGVEVRIKRSTAGATVTDNSVRLSLSGASIGSNLASATNYPTTLTWATYGGSSETWGAGLTDTQVKDSTFGVDISAKLSGTTSRTVSVDAVSVAVAYLPPGIYIEATDEPDTASVSVSVPVAITVAATDPADTASVSLRARTGSVMHVGTGATASAQNSSGSGASITVPLPNAWLPDDIFIMQVTVDNGGFPTISGWDQFCTVGTNALYWRRAEAGDTDPTFTVVPSYFNFARASISAWGDALKTGTPFESVVTGSSTPPTGGQGTCPDVAVTTPGSMIFSTAGYTAGSISFVSPFANIHQISQNFSSGTTASRLATTAGTNSGGSFTSSFFGNSHPTASFVLMPAPADEPEPTTITVAAIDPPDTAAIELTASAPPASITLGATEAKDVFAGSLQITGSLTLGATEAKDTFSGSLTVSDNTATLTLGATEAKDVLSGSLTATTLATLGATESRDAFSGSITSTTTVVLGATEAKDTFAGALTATTSLTLGATEAKDTFSGSAQVTASVILGATEARDTFAGSLQVISTLTLGAVEARDVYAGALGELFIVTLGATESPDAFSGSLTATTSATLGATEAKDTFAGALQIRGTLALGATESPDVFSGSLTVASNLTVAAVDAPDTASIVLSTLEPPPLGPGGWFSAQPTHRVKDRIHVDERAELRALILKAQRGETAEAEAVVEAVADFVETTQDDAVQIDWTALEQAQEQLAVVLQAIAVFQRHQQELAAHEAAKALALAQFEQEEDDLIALLLGA